VVIRVPYQSEIEHSIKIATPIFTTPAYFHVYTATEVNPDINTV